VEVIAALDRRWTSGRAVVHAWSGRAEEFRAALEGTRVARCGAMSSTGTWFVLVDPSRALSLAQLAARIADLPDTTLRSYDDALVLDVHDDLTGNDADLTVGYSRAPHVVIEAAELADDHERPDLARLEARYELLYDLRASDEVYNTLVRVAGALESACGGVIVDATSGRLV
jgi:hypothetical protein